MLPKKRFTNLNLFDFDNITREFEMLKKDFYSRKKKSPNNGL